MTVVIPETNNSLLRDTTLAGELLGLQPRTLENWRTLGRGPCYVKVGGRVRYRTSDLLEWLDRNTHGGEV